MLISLSLYKTGDVGRYLPSSGVVECCGRKDDQVKIRGFRVELREIDTFLQQHPSGTVCLRVGVWLIDSCASSRVRDTVATRHCGRTSSGGLLCAEFGRVCRRQAAAGAFARKASCICYSQRLCLSCQNASQSQRCVSSARIVFRLLFFCFV